MTVAGHPRTAGGQGRCRAPGQEASHAPRIQVEHLETGEKCLTYYIFYMLLNDCSKYCFSVVIILIISQLL